MKTKLLFKASILALLFAACNSEENPDTTVNADYKTKAAEQNELYVYRQEALESMKQTFYFNADNAERVTFESEKGVQIDINTRDLRYKGQRVHGKVKIEYIELTTRAEMLLTDMPTMAPSQVSESTPLYSGGEFYINMTNQEGQPLDEGSAYTLSVPTELTQGEGGGDDSDTGGMTLWEGEEDEEGNVKWEEETGEDGNPVEIPVVDGKYIVELLSFEWCNIDKLESIEGERTKIFVDVPDGYDGSNTSVYYVYTGAMNLLIELNYDPSSGDFWHNSLPIGMSGTIIMWSPGQSVVATKPLTIAGNDLVTITTGDLVTTTNAQLIAMLNSLP